MERDMQIKKYGYTSEEFGLRLAMLREQRQLSARQMSLDMGQNKNYISSIESGHNYPTMGNFFVICDYLNVAPEDFFESEEAPIVLNEEFIELVLQLPQKAKDHLYIMLSDLIERGRFPFF